MAKTADREEEKKREKIQRRFWSIVGSAEHINVPKLEDAIRKEFKTDDARFVEAQIRLMQTETKIRLQNKIKVWINQPETQNFSENPKVEPSPDDEEQDKELSDEEKKKKAKLRTRGPYRKAHADW